MEKVWLVTGCSTGIGQALVKELLKDGHFVVATARNPESLDIEQIKNKKRLLVARLDVTQRSEILQTIKSAIEKFGRIDVLVNNAGCGYYGTIEEADLSHVKEMFNVNVHGLSRVTQAVLPTMRNKRNGIIINISSVGGRVPLPVSGFYHASKFAVEALSEALYFETCKFGIRIIVVEPGGHNTEFSKSGTRSPQLLNPQSPYASLIEKLNSIKKEMVPYKEDPINVAKAIILAAEKKIPFQRIQVGTDAESLIELRDKSPDDSSFFKAINNLYGLGIEW